MRKLSWSMLSILFASAVGGPAFAARTTTKPGLVAKDAAAERGIRIDHSHEVGSVGRHQLVVGWRGDLRGRNVDGAYVMLVPSSKSRKDMLSGTRISQNLEQAGKAAVRAELRARGLSGSIALGDTKGGNRRKQRPMTREQGSIRFTAATPGKDRWLVPVRAQALLKGGRIIGKAYRDPDPNEPK